jgi:hypothetical protein
MTRILSSLVVCLVVAADAMAHFVFVVPEGTPKAAVILSEDLKADEDVDVRTLAGARLFARDAAGRDAALTPGKGEHALPVVLPAGTRVVHGVAEFGVRQRGKTKPHLLVYHPKTLVGDAFDPKGNVGAVVEIAPVGRAGDLRFLVTARGKPATAGVEVNLILPDGKEKKVVTGEDGRTPALEQPGRYGAWARHFEPVGGERDGKPFEETRHYATLVCDVAAPQAAAAGRPAIDATPHSFPPLPEATSSFGAVACDGWLYVYGGHTPRTHAYHTKAVSGRFHRLNLADGKTWEELPGGPGLQGMNLATHNGKVYRVGGMQPRNETGDRADNYSVSDVARFDPAAKRWEAMPPLPRPRSSHDVVVVGDKLIVLGGWDMRGRARGNDWTGTMEVMDLSAARPAWQTVPQPFERRALIAAVHGEKVYVIGGFDEDSDPSRRVDVYDVATGGWAHGPDLPGAERNGFAPAACVMGGRLYASVGDGSMLRLDESKQAWEKVGATTPRIVHRLVPHGPRILVLGGAAKGDNLNLVEVVTLGAFPDAAAAVGRRD